MTRRIAITQRVVENQNYPDRRDALSQDWSRYFARLFPRAALIPVPNEAHDAAEWLAALEPDAVVLSNGNDWGEAPERDRTETALYREATKRGTPVLGACRGLQAINMIEGGRVVHDVAGTCGENHVAQAHEVRIVEEAFAIIAGARMLAVNSYHNQGVALSGLAEGLRPFATGEGGLVEGLYHAEKAVLAIQWHPERDNAAAAFDDVLIRMLFESGAFWC